MSSRVLVVPGTFVEPSPPLRGVERLLAVFVVVVAVVVVAVVVVAVVDVVVVFVDVVGFAVVVNLILILPRFRDVSNSFNASAQRYVSTNANDDNVVVFC